MTRLPHPDRIASVGSPLLGALAAITLAACGTNEIRPDQAVLTYMQTDPTQGELLVVLTPTAETYEQELADVRENKYPATYHLLIDGKELVIDDGGWIQPLVVVRGGTYGAGFHAAGAHHFTLVVPGGATAVETDAVIASGAVTRFYVFGPAAPVQARFIASPVAPPAGDQHVSAINLVREGGVLIEVVACTDATTCAPVAPPLALGDTFNADVPRFSTSVGSSLSPTGAGYGYRQVPTASLPTPPILSMWWANSSVTPDAGVPSAFVAAPVYMATDGGLLGEVN
jgi:hypothetical protein